MNKLYRLMLLFMIVASFSFSANAQWNENLDQNLLISESGRESQDLVQIAKTSNNCVFIAWISWENEGAYIKLQLLDKDGNPLLGSGGMYVCKYPTPTWSSGFGFTVTKDDCAIIVNSDTRNGVEHGWKPYLYKVSQKGEHVWSPEGISILNKERVSGVDPRVCVTSDNDIIVGYRQLSKESSSQINVIKYNSDGTKAWGDNLKVVDLNTIFNLTPSVGGSFIVTYYELFSTNAGNYVAKKYTANAEEAWNEKVYIDECGTIKAQIEPSLVSDGAGGLITGYRFADGNINYGALQSLNSNGEKIFENEILGDLPVICTDPSNTFIYAAFKAISYGPTGLSLIKYDKSGSIMWENDEIVSDINNQYTLYGVVAVENLSFVIYRTLTPSGDMLIEYSKVSKDGNTIAQHIPISTRKSDKNRGGIALLERQYVLAWGERVSQTGGKIYAQNVKWENEDQILSQSNDDKTRVNIFRNMNGQCEIEITAVTEGITNLRLIDCTGNTVAKSTQFLIKGKNKFEYPMNRLSSGMYLFSLESNSIRLLEKIFVK